MSSIVLQNLGGLIPRVSPRLLANGAATVATMTKLWSGEIRPFINLGETTGAPMPKDAVVKTIYLLIDKWLAWTTDVDVVTGFTTLSGSGHIYYTGDGTPKQTTYDLVRFGPPTPIPGSTYPIGVVGPTTPPSVVIVGAPGGDPVVRDYVYTFISVMGEESVPSPPSALITVETGQSVNVDSFPVVTGTDVVALRIYRTRGGTYQFVAELPAPFPAVYNDAILDQDLGEQLQSEHYYPPPPDIKGLIGLACGSLAAFHGNKVVFSEPYQPGAWPPEYEKIFDYPVVALGTFGQTCVVATTGYTYLVSGNDPRSFSVARVPDPYPCVSKRSMVSSDNGCVYASSVGLIFVGTSSYVSGYSGTHVLTRDIMTYNEWQVYNPTTITGVIFDGRYYGFYNYVMAQPTRQPGAGFIFDASMRLVTGVTSESAFDKDDVLIDLDFFASATFANPQVPLHVVIDAQNSPTVIPNPPTPDPGTVVDNRLYQWEGGQGFHTYTWRSKQFSFPSIITFSAAKIICDAAEPKVLTFRLLDGSTYQVVYERTVSSSKPFRIPSLRPRTEWVVEVAGTSWVQMVQVSSAYADLLERKAA